MINGICRFVQAKNLITLMQKSLFLIVLLLILFSFSGTAQVATQIRTYVDSTEAQVVNGRKLLIQKLTQNNDHQANEIYQYLSGLRKENNSEAFNYTENIYASLLLGNWNQLINYLKQYRQANSQYPYPANDPLVKVLYDRLTRVADSLMAESQQSGLDTESQKVIALLLQYIKNGAPDDKYDRMYHSYKREYRTSAYGDFVNSYLPAATIKGSVSLGGGPGAIFPTGRLGEKFSPTLKSCFSLDFSINKAFVSLYVTGAGFNLKEPLLALSDTDSLFFSTEDTFSYFEGGMKAGYFLVRNNWLQVAPYFNISATNLESNLFKEEEDDGRELGVMNSFTFGPGVHTALKLYQYDQKDMRGFPNMFYFALKMDAGYNMAAHYEQKYFKGNTPGFIVGIVYGIGHF